MSRRRVITDEDRATALRMKAQMAPEGYGYNEILGAVADRLGMSKSTVKRLLKEEDDDAADQGS